MSARPEDVIAEALHMPRYWPGDVRFKRPSAILAALRTAGFVIEQDWQPIETAPRDGTIIDLWFSGDAWNCRMPGFVWRPGMNFWHNETTHQSYNESPLITHWRPLPTPPEGQP